MGFRTFIRSEMCRATLTEVATEIVSPLDPKVCAPLFRLVYLHLPEAPGCAFALDIDARDAKSVRAYMFSNLYSGSLLPIRLAPEQKLVGMSRSGNAFVTVVTEYHRIPGPGEVG
jgi:hypothetical protein